MFPSRAKTAALWMVLFGLMVAPVLAQDEESEEKEDSSIEVEMVVSASRKAEKKLEAPSTIETIREAALSESAATTFSAAAAQLKGVDYSNGGITLQRINARGFATSYQSRMLTTKNGRLETLPGASIPQGNLSTTSSLDIKAVEVVLGPASALYGSNASSGVFNVITKTPWDEKGTAVLLKGGEQSLFNTQLRHAGISSSGNWGWKVTGEYLNADDFDSQNFYFADGSNQSTSTPEQLAEALANGTAWAESDLADFEVNSTKWEVFGYYRSGDYQVNLGYGFSSNDGFGTTNLGRNRLENWEVETLSFEITHPNWYFQATQTENVAGDTYGIQNAAAALGAGIPVEISSKDPTIAGIFDDSGLIDLEFQANQTWGNVELIGGISYREFTPDSDGTFLNDGGDLSWHDKITREETGVYLQIDTRWMEEKLRLTGAVRYDDSNEYDSETSPKFSVTYTEGSHNYRFNYNRAHRDPSILENHLYFARQPALGNVNVALGNPVGWTVTNIQTGEQTVFPGLTPEIVDTFEVGYRGVFNGNLVIDAVYYDSEYENFISALQTIAFISAGTVAVRNDGRYGPEDLGGLPFPGWPLVLTYLNYGKAEVSGFDIGVDYYAGDNFHMNLSYGKQELDSFTNPTPIPDLPFNTPEDKIKGSLNFRNIGVENTFLSFAGRYVDEFLYASGRWIGTVGAYTIVDFSAGYTWEDQQTTFKLSALNLFDEEETELIGLPIVPRFLTFEVTKKF
ncbi:MAG: TonB-dependent receptor plug domain-containing protein [Acidobacteriota bacterium]|nr:TonB-dependent receptor plug domain-containing protein [Acidobacteriota bacterium]